LHAMAAASRVGAGKELFDLAPDRLLMVATIQTDATVQAEAPRALFETTLPLLPNRVRPTRCRLTDSDGG